MSTVRDTIAAVATAPGRGGVGIVRVSGPRARALAITLSGREPRRATPTTGRSMPTTAR